jgi:hypothetical protein
MTVKNVLNGTCVCSNPRAMNAIPETSRKGIARENVFYKIWRSLPAGRNKYTVAVANPVPGDVGLGRIVDVLITLTVIQLGVV